jgi:hypothetical protein
LSAADNCRTENLIPFFVPSFRAYVFGESLDGLIQHLRDNFFRDVPTQQAIDTGGDFHIGESDNGTMLLQRHFHKIGRQILVWEGGLGGHREILRESIKLRHWYAATSIQGMVVFREMV